MDPRIKPRLRLWSAVSRFLPDRDSNDGVSQCCADGCYQGAKLTAAVTRTGAWKLEIVKHSDAHGFVVLPKQWIIERTSEFMSKGARTSRNRRLIRVFERHARTVAAFVHLAMIRIMLKRLPRPAPCP